MGDPNLTAGPVVQQPQQSTLSPSLIRTLVPFIAGLVGTWIVSHIGLPIDSGTAGAVVTAVIGYVYYVVGRFLEVFVSDKWGYILGVRKLPVYAKPPLPKTVVARDEGGAASVSTAAVVIIVVGLVALVLSIIGALSWIWAVLLIAVGVALVLVDQSGPGGA